MSIYLDGENDIICAIATPPGHGGIAVIRVSGVSAVEIIRKCCSFLPEVPESHKVYYGYLKDEDNTDIDEVLCTYFAQGRSFTGEPVIEVSCHGGQYITQRVLSRIIDLGARLAEKGEFSFRAFSNGRIDLVQAESVLSLIQSETKRSSELSLNHLKGELSKTYETIEDELIWILAHLEANIDYAQEDIQVAEESLLFNKLLNVENIINKLIESFHDGRRVKDGVFVSLIGLPNAGKSSLMNAILKQDRSIVTDVEGTTRDFIEESFFYKNQKYIFTDTAGLRQTNDKVEKIGIQKTLEKINESDVVVVLLDPTQPISQQMENFKSFNVSRSIKTIFVINKQDLVKDKASLELSSLEVDPSELIFISAKQRLGIESLLEKVARHSSPISSESSVLVTQLRHYELLKSALEYILKAKECLTHSESPEFVIFELQSSVHQIQEILGKQFDDEVMDRVFKEFCLGK